MNRDLKAVWDRWPSILFVGSNIGNKEENLNRAIELINSYKEIEVEKVSSFLVTEPWGYLDQEEFVNAALKLKTILSPQELMKILLDIEQEMKRERIIILSTYPMSLERH